MLCPRIRHHLRRALGSTLHFRLVAVADSRLGRRQPRDRHAIRRTGDVVHAHSVTELNGTGLSTVLATDTYFQIGTSFPAELDRMFDDLANTVLIEYSERIGLEDLQVFVMARELRVVVTLKTHCRLR